ERKANIDPEENSPSDAPAHETLGDSGLGSTDTSPTDDVVEPASSSSPDRRVRIGDHVRVRFADGQARSLKVQIVTDGSADGRERIAPQSPLAAVILGLRAEDEAEVVIGGKPRKVIVEAIQETAQEAA